MNFINQSIVMLASAEGSEEGSGNILETLGVHWTKLFAQVILFLIVFLVLRKFAFGPVRQKREEATKEASAIVAKAHEAGALEQQQLRAELKRDVGRLIIDTTTKVTGKILNDDDQAKINEETSSQISL
jgi:F0F1-type ATP synthase membrane subunit b/b'